MVSSLFTFLRNKAFLWSLGLCILTLPFQVKVLLFETQWGHGLANPYASIFVSAFDVALLLASTSFLIFEKKKKWTLPPLPLILFISLAALSLIISPYHDDVFHFLLVLKLGEALLFYTLLKQLSSKELLIKLFTGVMSVEALWALGQVLFQQDFGLQILGETALSASTANLARFSIGNLEFIRGYGSFSHPNVLGGFLAISIFLSLHSTLKKNEKTALLTIQFLGLLATFSRSALLALLLATFLTNTAKKLFQTKKIRLAFLTGALLALGLFTLLRGLDFLSDPALLERLNGYHYAWEMIKNYPLGVGFSHFTLFLDNIATSALQPWEYQPVHNIFVLTLAELGIPFFILLLAGCAYSIKTKPVLAAPLLILVIIGLFDHYLLTQDQGRFLLIFALSLLTMKEAVHHKTSADPVEKPRS